MRANFQLLWTCCIMTKLVTVAVWPALYLPCPWSSPKQWLSVPDHPLLPKSLPKSPTNQLLTDTFLQHYLVLYRSITMYCTAALPCTLLQYYQVLYCGITVYSTAVLSSTVLQHFHELRSAITAIMVVLMHCKWHYTALNCTLNFILVHCSSLYCTTLQRTTLNCSALHCTTLNCTTLNCSALQCTTLHHKKN